MSNFYIHTMIIIISIIITYYWAVSPAGVLRKEKNHIQNTKYNNMIEV